MESERPRVPGFLTVAEVVGLREREVPGKALFQRKQLIQETLLMEEIRLTTVDDLGCIRYKNHVNNGVNYHNQLLLFLDFWIINRYLQPSSTLCKYKPLQVLLFTLLQGGFPYPHLITIGSPSPSCWKGGCKSQNGVVTKLQLKVMNVGFSWISSLLSQERGPIMRLVGGQSFGNITGICGSWFLFWTNNEAIKQIDQHLKKHL